MNVAICGFGSLWTVRRGARPVYYNSTAINHRSRPVEYGVVRVEPGTGFDPHHPGNLIGRVCAASGIAENAGRRQLTLHRRVTGAPEGYLLCIRSARFGRIDRTLNWKSDNVSVISFSETATEQQVLLLAQPHSWIRTATQTYFLRHPLKPALWKSGVLIPGEACAI